VSKTLTAVRQQLLLARSLMARPPVELLNPLSSVPGDVSQLLRRMRDLEAESGHSGSPERAAPEMTRALYDLERTMYEAPSGLAEARAFWINLYNLLTLHGVFHARVRETVLEVPGFTKRFAYRVSELDFSLDDIEHGVLRENRALNGRAHFAPDDPKLGFTLPLEPRVHFALNCGAVSCPAIRAYDGQNLDHQLENAMKSYLSDARVEHGRVVLPRIFQWYARDFGSDPRAALDFVRRYRTDLPKFAPVVFDEYDWRLPGNGVSV
jgi:Protein of unknown function, DUF547